MSVHGSVGKEIGTVTALLSSTEEWNCDVCKKWMELENILHSARTQSQKHKHSLFPPFKVLEVFKLEMVSNEAGKQEKNQVREERW